MRFIKKHFALLVLFSIIFVPALIINGCGEENVTTPQSEHFEPAGLFILPEGSTSDTLLSVFNTVVRQGDTLKAPYNTFSVRREVFFWDENKNVITMPADGSHTLGFAINDSSVIEIQMDNPNDNAFRLKGITQPGDTASIQLKVFHQGHSDFTTPFVPVKVE